MWNLSTPIFSPLVYKKDETQLSITIIRTASKLVDMLLLFIHLFSLSKSCDLNSTESFDECFEENLIFIQSENVGITLFKSASGFQLYAMQNESYAVYNTSLESIFHLTYDDDFKINGKELIAIDSEGTIALPDFLKMLLANSELDLSVVESIELCIDFTTERNILKVMTAVLSFMLFVTNFKDGQRAYRRVSKNVFTKSKSTFSDRFISWRELPTVLESDDITPASINTISV